MITKKGILWGLLSLLSWNLILSKVRIRFQLFFPWQPVLPSQLAVLWPSLDDCTHIHDFRAACVHCSTRIRTCTIFPVARLFFCSRNTFYGQSAPFSPLPNTIIPSTKPTSLQLSPEELNCYLKLPPSSYLNYCYF